MKPQLFLWLGGHRRFWSLRLRADRLRFKLLRSVFGARFLLWESGKSVGPIWEFVRISLGQLTFALLAVVVLYSLDYLFASSRLTGILPIPGRDIYTNFLTTIAQIGGVFIGLFYAGLTAAAAAIYAQVPNNIRDLLARERIGSLYVRFLTLVTFLALTLLVPLQLGFEPSRTAVPVMTVLSGIGVIAFVQLGRRAFYLFDPTGLSYAAFDDLERWLQQVTAGGFRWLDKNFQNHAHKQASTVLDVLDTLVDFSSGEKNLSGRPLVELSRSIRKFLVWYTYRKTAIPTNSLWYQQHYTHKNWYETEDHTVQMSFRTGVALQPQKKSNLYWVEDRIEDSIAKTLQANLTLGRFELAIEAVTTTESYLSTLASVGELQRAIKLINTIQNLCKEHLAIEQPRLVLENENLDHIGLVEYFGYLPLVILLAYCNSLDDRTPTKNAARLSRINWESPNSIYKQNFPLFALEQVEWLLPRMQFELLTEDEFITPLWYQVSILNLTESNKFNESVSELLSLNERFYGAFSDEYLKRGHPLLAAAILSRQIEFLHKTEYQLQTLDSFAQQLDKARVIALSWPEIKPATWREELSKHRHALLARLSKITGVLFIEDRPKDSPDYRGQFLHELGEHVFNSVFNNDVALLKQILPTYFNGSFLNFAHMRPKALQTTPFAEQQLHIAASNLHDLIALSGYAVLFAEYHNNPELAEVVKMAWDEHFDNKRSALPGIAAAVQFENYKFRLPHRGIIRSNWSIRVEELLRRLPKKVVVQGRFSEVMSAVHPSPLVRTCANANDADGIEIFVALYLSLRAEATGLDWGFKRPKDFRRRIEREQEPEGDDAEEE
jgi:hypothetical protein